MSGWLAAFLLTQAVEMPIWLTGGRRTGLGWRRALFIAFGTSAITHPLLWFVLPWDRWPYLPTIIIGELLVISAEALLAGQLGIRRPWQWSLLANSASIAVSLLTRWAFGWP